MIFVSKCWISVRLVTIDSVLRFHGALQGSLQSPELPGQCTLCGSKLVQKLDYSMIIVIVIMILTILVIILA